MHRIDSPNAGDGNSFSGGNPGTGVPPTEFTPAWCQAVQEEIAHVVEQAGITLVKANNTQLLAGILAHIGAQAGGDKNAVINGGFRVWQRGTSIAAIDDAGAWTADRWQAFADAPGGSGVATVTRQVFDPGQSDVADAPIHFLRWQQTTPASAGDPRLQTKIEDVRSYAGSLTLSVWLKAGAAGSYDLEVHQNFGSGGSSEVLAGTSTVAVTTSWARYTLTVALPSIAGKTVGTGSHLRVAIRPPSGVAFTADVAQVQLERGIAASPFELRPMQREVALCERYFAKSYDLDTAPGTATQVGVIASGLAGSGNTAATRVQRTLPTTMRAAPTVTWYAPDGTKDRIKIGAGNWTVTANNDEGQRSTGYPTLSSVPGSADQTVLAHYTADAEL